MWAGGDRGETERLQAMENGSSVIPDKVKGAREFAGRKPGKVRDVETVGKLSRYALVDRLRQPLGLAGSSSIANG